MGVLSGGVGVVGSITFFSIGVVFNVLYFRVSLGDYVFRSSFLLTIVFLARLITRTKVSTLLGVPVSTCGAGLTTLFVVNAVDGVLCLVIYGVISSLFSCGGVSRGTHGQRTALFLCPVVMAVALALFLCTSAGCGFSGALGLVYTVIYYISLIFYYFVFVCGGIVRERRTRLVALRTRQREGRVGGAFCSLLRGGGRRRHVLIRSVHRRFSTVDNVRDARRVGDCLSGIRAGLSRCHCVNGADGGVLSLVLDGCSFIYTGDNVGFGTRIETSGLSFVGSSSLITLLSGVLSGTTRSTGNSRGTCVSFSMGGRGDFIILGIGGDYTIRPGVVNSSLRAAGASDSVRNCNAGDVGGATGGCGNMYR